MHQRLDVWTGKRLYCMYGLKPKSWSTRATAVFTKIHNHLQLWLCRNIWFGYQKCTLWHNSIIHVCSYLLFNVGCIIIITSEIFVTFALPCITIDIKCNAACVSLLITAQIYDKFMYYAKPCCKCVHWHLNTRSITYTYMYIHVYILLYM